MTTPQDNKLMPGRELDALVAEKVMGLIPKQVCYLRDRDGDFYRTEYYKEDGPIDMWGGRVTHELKPYSTDISAAFEIVEKLRIAGFILVLQRDARARATFTFWNDAGMAVREGTAYSETVPHVICLAALKAIGHE